MKNTESEDKAQGQSSSPLPSPEVELFLKAVDQELEAGEMKLADLGSRLAARKPAITPQMVGCAKLSSALKLYASDRVKVVTFGTESRVIPRSGEPAKKGPAQEGAPKKETSAKAAPQKGESNKADVRRFVSAVAQEVAAGGAMTLSELGSRLAARTPSVTASTVGKAKLSSALEIYASDVVQLVTDGSVTRVTPLEAPRHSLESPKSPAPEKEQASTSPSAQELVQLVRQIMTEERMLTSTLRDELSKRIQGFSPKNYGFGSMKTLVKGLLGQFVTLNENNTVLKKVAPKKEPWLWQEGGKSQALSDQELMSRLQTTTLDLIEPGDEMALTKLTSLWRKKVPSLTSMALGYDRWQGLISALSSELSVEKGKVRRAGVKKAQPQPKTTPQKKEADKPKVQVKAPQPPKLRPRGELEALTDGLISGPTPLSKVAAALKERDPSFRPNSWGENTLRLLVSRHLSHKWVLSRRNNADWVAPRQVGKSERPTVVVAQKSERVKVYDFSGGKIIVPEGLFEALAQTTLPEVWEFADDKVRFSVLKDYLGATIKRLDSQKGLNLDPDRGQGGFHTGLVDTNYEDLYAYLSKEPQGWEVRSFCLAGQSFYGKLLTRAFESLPPRPLLPSPQDLVYGDARVIPQVDWNHVLIDRVGRIPLEVLRSAGLDVPATEGYLSDVPSVRQARHQLRNDAVAHRRLKALFETAIRQTLSRLYLDYRLAVPLYRLSTGTMSMALPLDLSSGKGVDCALIVERLPNGEYLGHTIYPLRWVYRGARALYRPTVAWLDPHTLPKESDFDATLPEGKVTIKQPKPQSTAAEREGFWNRVTGWIRRK